MSEIIPNIGLRENQQFVFLNGDLLSGCQSANLSYQTVQSPIKYLGMQGQVLDAPNGTESSNLSVSNLLLCKDFLIHFTGNSGINGSIVKGLFETGDNFSFQSGYLTSYNSRCSIGTIPTTEANFIIFGKVGKLNINDIPSYFEGITGYTGNYPLKIASPNSIEINIDDFLTNRVLSYDLSIEVPRNPIYINGLRIPINVFINGPIEVTCSFQIDKNDYQSKKNQDYPCDKKYQNLILKLKDFYTNEIISEFNFSGMQLISENYTSSSNGNPTIGLIYKKYINRI